MKFRKLMIQITQKPSSKLSLSFNKMQFKFPSSQIVFLVSLFEETLKRPFKVHIILCGARVFAWRLERKENQ